ncbi:MAG TPA: VCBS repeat-containing protein, partial [Puia sp.]|nr:VCBS repeat-containing protein [Puia sp.]
PKMLSTEGPKLAIGDVNGDGLPDFFMGGAKNDTAKLFIQQPDGHFIQKPEFVFAFDKDNEDVGATFFDADNDGDLDLVVVSGGNQDQSGSQNLLSRLYINDGKGNFTRSFNWPLISMNASCVRVNDVDGDGLQDVFIGGRSIPGDYGQIPGSVLLHNDGKGKFTNVTQSMAPDLLHLGMVTDAQWADIDGDGKKELIVVGDWMPVTILKYVNGQLRKIGEIPHSSGWWNCVTIADINGDGYVDLVAGNFGLNSRIKADVNHPAKLYVGDFDKNGQSECIPVYYKSDGKAYPYYLRGDMVAQIPALKKKFLRYDAYAGKSIDEIFDKDQLAQASILTVEQTQTCAYINDGKGNFTLQNFPVMAQLSPVFGIVVADLNGDGIKDIFLGGNFFGLKPEVGRFDASYGTTLIGNNKHQFTYISPSASGLFVKGEVRDAQIINAKKEDYIIVARNNDALQIFRKRK